MLISADVVRAFLGIGVVGMALLAVFYLRQRRMPFDAYILWGLLAIFVPIFGPFWVIYKHPGRPIWSHPYHTSVKHQGMLGQRKRAILHWPKKWVTGR